MRITNIHRQQGTSWASTTEAKKTGRRVCKDCKKEKDYIYSHTTANLARRYRDETGHVWNAATCYECHYFKNFILKNRKRKTK